MPTSRVRQRENREVAPTGKGKRKIRKKKIIKTLALTKMFPAYLLEQQREAHRQHLPISVQREHPAGPQMRVESDACPPGRRTSRWPLPHKVQGALIASLALVPVAGASEPDPSLSDWHVVS